MDIKTEADVELADKLVQLRKKVDGVEDGSSSGREVKVALAGVLDLTHPDWKERQDFIDRVKMVGPTQAAQVMLARYGL